MHRPISESEDLGPSLEQAVLEAVHPIGNAINSIARSNPASGCGETREGHLAIDRLRDRRPLRMAAGEARMRLGDVVEIPTAKGLVYGQLSHTHAMAGEVLRILPGYFESRPAGLESLVAGPTRYFVLLAVDVAVRRLHMFQRLQHLPVPEHVKRFEPIIVVPFSEDEGPVMWKLWDGESEWISPTPMHEGRRLPQPSSHSPRLVIDELGAGLEPNRGEMFLPEPQSPMIDLSGSTPLVVPLSRIAGEVRHFLYFSDRATAKRAREALRAIGLQNEMRAPQADEHEWMVIATVPAANAAGLEETRVRLEGLASECGGEYDGWEAPVSGGKERERSRTGPAR